MIAQSKHILVDGRVFSTAAHDRGMGRYVMHFLSLLEAGDHHITLLLFRNCQLAPDNPMLAKYAIRFADYDPEHDPVKSQNILQEMHHFTAFLSGLIEREGYDAYIDATPFIAPLRLDLFGCPVIAICYDLIPLRHPAYYLASELGRRVYYNGLARLVKADFVVTISETVREEILRYLGIAPDRQLVVRPALEQRYHAAPARAPAAAREPYLFSIVGFHKSKNPDRAMRICGRLLTLGRFNIRINAPDFDQLATIHDTVKVPAGVELSAAITDDEKFDLQSNALVVAHFSIEEGFGIPLLEAFFLHRKVLAVDTPINREFLRDIKASARGAVFLLPPVDTDIDLAAFASFLDEPADPAFYEEIRANHMAHWSQSAGAVNEALAAAADNYVAWIDQVQAKIFSSIPGSFCGVADYSVGYTRSAPGNILFFFSEGLPENVSFLKNVRALTHLDFERVSRSRLGQAPSLFNFAFSQALDPGIELMRKHAAKADVALIHERRYFDGLRTMARRDGLADRLLQELVSDGNDDQRTRLAIDFAMHPVFNTRAQSVAVKSPIRSDWLQDLPLRFVSHLPPALLHQMDLLEAEAPGSVINDLADMEDRISFVPMGIDDRSGPGVRRAAQHLRTLRGIQQDDIVIGHSGLIVNDIKRLFDISRAVVAFATALRSAPGEARRVFFSLSGRIVDQALYDKIQDLFHGAGLADRLIHSNPLQEAEFDAEIAACDAVFCFRLQHRGHQSHALVRALSLATPVIVNERSGFAYDPEITIEDAELDSEINRVLWLLADPSARAAMRQRARRRYDDMHRGDHSLAAILQDAQA